MQEVRVKVIAVHDGDSIRVEDTAAGLRYWVRVKNIDAPEVYAPGYSADQPYGKESGNFARYLLKGETVSIEVDAKRDVWGRRVGKVFLAGLDFARESVMFGHAWAGMGPGKYLNELRELEKVARDQQRGLWGTGDAPVRPLVWRKRHMGKRSAQPALSADIWADEPI